MEVMQRDPVLIPRRSGVFILRNKKRRLAYVAFSSDLQKRSHSLAHMLSNPKTHWSIRDMPKHPAGEFTFSVLSESTEEQAAKIMTAAARQISAQKYRLVGGSRAAMPTIVLNGVSLPLTDAIARSKCKEKYITVWRRLDRGWTPEQALGIDPPPVRWDPDVTAARRKRAHKRANGN
jgi:hypothetical protein